MKHRGMDRLIVIVASSAGIYFALSLAMAFLPAMSLATTAPGPGVRPLTPLEARGRDVYVAEGCSYCHTQQVRPLAQDAVWGRPSTAGDYVYSTPELLGTERNGPDLTNIGARQPSAVWHAIHLFEPRALVHDSIMPAYPWMFVVKDHADPGDTVVSVPQPYAPAGKVVVEGPEALALIAYLQGLKQAPLPVVSP
jgi:cytochrome c oxidase cbb3-type subunit 2